MVGGHPVSASHCEWWYHSNQLLRIDWLLVGDAFRIAKKMRRFGTFPSQESGRSATEQVLLFRQQEATSIPGKDILRFGESVLAFRGIRV
jgi:flavin-dependent dehydrogenase